jgi:4-diphosphocytidyl-2-C-methyl-D-erythritol kinase
LTLKILSPAKINLFLHVTGRRPDGYHNIISLMCCIGLYDIISMDFKAKKITVTCNNPDVPDDESNLAFLAARQFYENMGKSDGLSISIEKHIPVGSGLGGGSSNAATVLLSLNRYYQEPFSQEELMTMGLAIGADIPFYIFKQPAIATGIGEKLKVFDRLDRFWVVLIYPGFGVSTEMIYKNLDLRLTICKKKVKNFLLNKQWFNPENHLCNDLETVAASKYPQIYEAKKALIDCGASGSLMTGSGSAVFGLFDDFSTAQGARQAILKKHTWDVYLTDMLI